jgi:hypothetical protein
MTALLHREFRMTLCQFTTDPRCTKNERDLATLALSIYDLVPDHPLVVNFVNEYSQKVFRDHES